MSSTFENAIRPDFVVDVVAKPNKDFVVKPLAIWERVLDSDGFRRAMAPCLARTRRRRRFGLGHAVLLR